MKTQEIKTALKIEYKLKTGEYSNIELGDDRRSWDDTKTVFDIRFDINFKTFMFCDRYVKEGYSCFKMLKIVTFGFDGIIKEFISIEDFRLYIESLEIVELARYW